MLSASTERTASSRPARAENWQALHKAAFAHCAGASRPRRPSEAVTENCIPRLGDGLVAGGSVASLRIRSAVGPALSWREGGHACSGKKLF